MSSSVTFDSATPRFGLPNLYPGQAQKEFFVNEALGKLDGLLFMAVEAEADDPPATPSPSEGWIIGPNPTNEWTGQAGKIALRTSAGWDILDPTEGMQIFDKNLAQFRRYNGSWLTASAPTPIQGGTTVDAEARAALGELVAALRDFGVFSSI